VRDPLGITGWPQEKGRDGERTPMQWDASNPQAGFTTSRRPWLPVAAGYDKVNVEAELADGESLLNWHKKLIALRRGDPALRDGRLVMLDPANPHVLTYARVTPEGSAIVVSLNMSAQSQTVALKGSAAGLAGYAYHTLLSSPGELAVEEPGTRLTLPPFGAWVAALE
jgi:alpha-glucosidase